MGLSRGQVDLQTHVPSDGSSFQQILQRPQVLHSTIASKSCMPVTNSMGVLPLGSVCSLKAARTTFDETRDASSPTHVPTVQVNLHTYSIESSIYQPISFSSFASN